MSGKWLGNGIAVLGIMISQGVFGDVNVSLLRDTEFKQGFMLGRELQTSSNCTAGYEQMCQQKAIKWSASQTAAPVWMTATWGSQGSLTDSWGVPSSSDYICTSGSGTACELKAKVKSGLFGSDFLARTNSAGMPLRWDGTLPVASMISPVDGNQVSAAAGLMSLDTVNSLSSLIYSSITVPPAGGEISLKANTFNENYFKDVIPVVQPDGVTPVYSTPFLYEVHADIAGGNVNGKMDDFPRGPYLWESQAVEPAQPHLYLGQGAGLVPVAGMKSMNFHAKVKVVQDRLDTCDNQGRLPAIHGCISDTFGSAWTTFDFLFWNPATGRSFNVRIPVFDMRNSFGGQYDVKKVQWTDSVGAGGITGEYDKTDSMVFSNEVIFEKSQAYAADGAHGGKKISSYGGMGYQIGTNGGFAMSLNYYDNGTPTFILPAYKFVPALDVPGLIPGITDIDAGLLLNVDNGNRVQRDGGSESCTVCPVLRDESGAVVGHPNHSYRKLSNGNFYIDTPSGTEFHRSSQNEYSVLSTNPDPSRGTRFAADVGSPDDGTDDGFVSELGFVTHVESGWVTFDGDLLPYFEMVARSVHDSAVTKWIENSCSVANETNCIDPDTVDPDFNNYRLNLIQVSSWESNTLSVSELKISDLSFDAVVDDFGDFDGDGLVNKFEYDWGLDPATPRIDGNPDYSEAMSDSDGDGLTATQEQLGGFNPNDADSDNDGIGDAEELDTDNDGLPDVWELANARNPLVADYMVSAGFYHTCALDDDGVKCWGLNADGQASVPALRDPVQVSAGGYHTCALDAVDLQGHTAVRCWGRNAEGQSSVPVLNNPVAVSAGAYGTCALDADGLKCWGLNSDQQNTVPMLSNPTQIDSSWHHCALDDTGVHCWGRNMEGQSTVPSLENPTEIAVGAFHSCAVTGGDVNCWGADSEGQSSLLSAETFINPRQLALGFLHTCVLDAGSVRCFAGNDAYGAASVPALSQPGQITAGWRHTCALDATGVKCWGAGTSNTGAEPHYGQSVVPYLNMFGWTKDTDSDGVTDDVDAFPQDTAESLDTDKDSIGNNADADDDNDGLADASDPLPLQQRALAGVADMTFGKLGSGMVSDRIALGGDAVNAVMQQSDGKIVAVGYADVNPGSAVDYDWVIARYNADGTLDSGFDQDGILVVGLPDANDFAKAVVEQQIDGAPVITVGGYAVLDGLNQFVVLQFNADGSWYSATNMTVVAGKHAYLNALALQSDGKLVAAGYTETASSGADIAVVRYNEDLSLDTTFNSAGTTPGVATTNYGGSAQDKAFAVAVQSDGKIVAAGSTLLTTGVGLVVRYTPEGVLDTGGFGNGGKVLLSGSSQAYGVVPQASGTVVAAGSTLFRLNGNGSLDSGFGVSGKVTMPSGWLARSVVAQTDGKLVAAGSGSGNYVALRLDPSAGSLDASFGCDINLSSCDGKVMTDIAGGSDVANAVIQLADGKLLLAGSGAVGGDSDFALVRYFAGSDVDGDGDTDGDGYLDNVDAYPLDPLQH